MQFHLIDLETWPRREHFQHYLERVPCGYSMTVDLDLTRLLPRLKERGLRLYPTLIWALSQVVNRHPEFRMDRDAQGRPGYYEEVWPTYTVFHPEDETFSALWSQYDPDFLTFYRRCVQDMETYGENRGMQGRPEPPEHLFNISCLPWQNFSSFHLELDAKAGYLLPIFTIGRYRRQGEQVLLPLAVQVHHAACDGFHTCRLIEELQQCLDGLLAEPGEDVLK